jgi:hypothetical protein
VKSSLDYKKNFLCVLTESKVSDGPRGAVLVREWHPGPGRGGGGGPHAGRTRGHRGQFRRRNLRRRGGQRVSVSRKRQEQTDGSRRVCIGGRAGGRRRSSVSQWPGTEGRQSGGSRERQSPRQGEAGKDTEQKGKASLGSRTNGLGGCVDDGAAREDSGSAAPMFAQLNLREKFAEFVGSAMSRSAGTTNGITTIM